MSDQYSINVVGPIKSIGMNRWDGKQHWAITKCHKDFLTLEQIVQQLFIMDKYLEYQKGIELCSNHCIDKMVYREITEKCANCKDLKKQLDESFEALA